jgi:two-component system NtrC family sensor kinase
VTGKILVIDDNLAFAEMVKKILEDNGFHVSIATNGKSAVEKVSSESPELVILDLQLPDISGGQLLERVKEIRKDTAIIVVTGYGGEQVAVDLMRRGAIDFLSKPVDHEVLLTAVKNALKIREAQIEDRQFERYPSLETFFPFLAHEIRNPLHAIAGALAIIHRRSDLKDELLAQSMKIIEEEVQHLNEFVQECLNFVRPLNLVRFNEFEIKEVLSIVINIVSHMFGSESKKIKLMMDMDPQLPKICASYEEIKQAFLNIVKNAFEAMPEGGTLNIRARLKPGSSEDVEILFVDDGIGIRKENLGYLFNPFFTTKLRGTGLGLAISRRIIVERHHGKISVESEQKKGTAVKVELPIRDQSKNPIRER